MASAAGPRLKDAERSHKFLAKSIDFRGFSPHRMIIREKVRLLRGLGVTDWLSLGASRGAPIAAENESACCGAMSAGTDGDFGLPYDLLQPNPA
jgi:hypothetical protein